MPHAGKAAALYPPPMLAGIASNCPQLPAGAGGTVNEPLIAAIHDSLNPVTERRHDPRYPAPYSTVVHGVDASGREFEAEGELGDVSAGGLYVRLAVRVEPGSRLTAEVFISGGRWPTSSSRERW